MNLIDVLNEGYKEHKEVTDLTTDILRHFSEKNIASGKRWYKQYKTGDDFAVDGVNYDSFYVREATNPDDYKYLNDMLMGHYKGDNREIDRRYLSITFLAKLGSAGVYNGGFFPLISIKFPTTEFEDSLIHNFDVYSAQNTKDMSNDDIVRAVRSSMGVAYRAVIMHELQHAYDDYRSGGKYTDRKSSNKDYYKSISDIDFNSPTRRAQTPEEYAKYMGLAHEYWARFTEAVNGLSSTIGSKPFEQTAVDFKSKIGGWQYIDDDAKKRLLKALYKMWDERRKK